MLLALPTPVGIPTPLIVIVTNPFRTGILVGVNCAYTASNTAVFPLPSCTKNPPLVFPPGCTHNWYDTLDVPLTLTDNVTLKYVDCTTPTLTTTLDSALPAPPHDDAPDATA
jgi:hypothetical protein